MTQILRDIRKPDEEPKPQAQERFHQKTNNMVFFRQLLDHHQNDKPATAKALGYSQASIGKWLQDGEIPFVVSLASEALMRRMGTAGRPNVLGIATASFSVAQTLRKVFEGLGVTEALSSFPVAVAAGTRGDTPGVLVLRIPHPNVAAMESLTKGLGGQFMKLEI